MAGLHDTQVLASEPNTRPHHSSNKKEYAVNVLFTAMKYVF
jgi:hypothetical protein